MTLPSAVPLRYHARRLDGRGCAATRLPPVTSVGIVAKHCEPGGRDMEAAHRLSPYALAVGMLVASPALVGGDGSTPPSASPEPERVLLVGVGDSLTHGT